MFEVSPVFLATESEGAVSKRRVTAKAPSSPRRQSVCLPHLEESGCRQCPAYRRLVQKGTIFKRFFFWLKNILSTLHTFCSILKVLSFNVLCNLSVRRLKTSLRPEQSSQCTARVHTLVHALHPTPPPNTCSRATPRPTSSSSADRLLQRTTQS